MTAVRIFAVGGLISYRALFYWLTPMIYIPSLVVAPIFQILLMAYIGRSAGLASDEFYVVGNAIQYAAVPCLFAMMQLVGGEKHQNTLGAILVSPAPRLPLFFGRAVPVVLNGAFVAAFSLLVGSLILGVEIPAESIPALALVILVAAFSCTGLGLINAALALRVRESAVLSNVLFGFLLIFTGANVPLSDLPDWMQTVSQWIPFTHAIEAARSWSMEHRRPRCSTWSARSCSSAPPTSRPATGSSRSSRTRAVATRRWSAREGPPPHGHRLALPVQAAVEVVLRQLPRDPLADLLRDRRLLHVPLGREPGALIYASLGAAVMGIWSATSLAAGTALQRERWHGTLELLVAAPSHFALVLLPVGLATSTIGVYCMAATLLWGRFVFGIDLPLDEPFMMALAIPATLLSIGALGFLMGIAFARYRYAWALGSMTEYPIWLICGFLVPLTLLPAWVPPISWLLAPTWGMNAIRQSSTGGSPLDDIAMWCSAARMC